MLAQIAQLSAHNAELAAQNEQLRTTADDLGELFQRAPIPLLAIDGRARVGQANDAAVTLLGVTHPTLLGGRLDAFVAAASLPAFRALLADAERGDGRSVGELTLAIDETRTLLTQLTMVRRGAWYVCSLVELTTFHTQAREQRESEVRQARRRADEVLHTFAIGVGDRLTDKLASLVVNLDIALEQGTPTSCDAIADAVTATQDVVALTARLRAYTGRTMTPDEEVDLPALLGRLTTLAGIAAGASSLSIEIPNVQATVVASAAELAQVILELVRNAAEARAKEICVTLRSVTLTTPDIVALDMPDRVAPGRYIVLELADDGRGVSPEHHDRIWHPFFTTKETGRGLGLSVVQGIAAARRGIIQLASSSPRGSVFRVFLPTRP